MLKSVELLRNTPKLDSKLYDKLFILAEHRLEVGVHRFIINGDTPTVRLNDRVALDVPTVKDIQNDPKYCLVSANAFLYIEDCGYMTLLRDGGAPVYPHHYTVPAGRCEQSPRKTAISELNQELCVKLAKTDNITEQTILGFDDWTVARMGKHHKEKCMNQKLGALTLTKLIEKPSALDETYTFEVEGISSSGGKAAIVYDEKTNCYELCFRFTAKLPKNWKIDSVCDGDGFGRSVRWIKTLNELESEPCVPALKELIARSK